ncbi:hypothetical protein K0C01_10250 [Salinarchaeum sp. IM2453]|uniref:hypothetical protein n=1 Tax=Salinarchaeum sp. IM2453 TaxID=2862870 RepID=UPI001C830906|nr:hypothetical protein [Salinarchaeum sp. IM2453]QZA88165.1 hypothetical protein K0C01_10250 [Salinarchaeum sp. IM2453]
MSVNTGGHRQAAIQELAAQAYDSAGDEYSRAAWSVLSDPREDVDTFELSQKGWTGIGISYLLKAAICYRVAGLDTRAEQRGTAGLMITKDLIGRTERTVQVGCLKEMGGDFRVIADLGEAKPVYKSAVSTYQDVTVDDPQSWTTTPLFEAAASPLKQLARGQENGEIAVTWEDLHGSDPSQPSAFLAHRVKYKHQHLPAYLTQAIKDSMFAAPRGSTAYNTDSYQCPTCGSRDVNWTGDSTLCLRCSSPTEKR